MDKIILYISDEGGWEVVECGEKKMMSHHLDSYDWIGFLEELGLETETAYIKDEDSWD